MRHESNKNNQYKKKDNHLFKKIIRNYISNIYKYLSSCQHVCMSGIKIDAIQKNIEEKFFIHSCKNNIKNIPIYILSYNRVTYLKEMIRTLEKYELSNITIIDNASTYLPLLDYYKSLSYKIIYMNKNYGHNVFFKHKLFLKIRLTSFYIYTDPDVIPIKGCPDNFLDVFYSTLKNNLNVNKVGFSLKIDDLPDIYEFKQNVVAWESQFYKKIIQDEEVTLYDAKIDTTFALYRPQIFSSLNFYSGIRTGFPYQARHLPWYKARDQLSDEDIFYTNTSLTNVGNWNYNCNMDTLEKRYSK